MYYITLSRKPSVEATEWKTLIENSLDLTPTDTIPRMNLATSEIMHIPMPGSAVWTGHPAGTPFHFMMENNKIIVGAADHFVKRKAGEIAVSLGAEMTCSID